MPAGPIRLPVIDKQDIRFVRLSVRGEPFRKKVLSLVQDNYGFVWLGTDDGLYRYDGYTLKPYGHDPNNPRSLTDNSVFALYKDQAGTLWIGTLYGGLDRFDPAREVFTHYRHDPHDSRSLRDGHVVSIYQDTASSLWIGTIDGLDRLEIASGRFLHYPHPSENKASSDTVEALYEDGQGNLLVGSHKGLYTLKRSSGRLSLFSSSAVVSGELDNAYVFSFTRDHSGALWAALPFGSGLVALSGETGEARPYAFNSTGPWGPQLAGVTRVREDRNGALWIGTLQGELFKFDKERTNFFRYPVRPDSGIRGEIWALLEDSEGTMWVGSDAGVSRFQPAPFQFVNYQAEPRNSNILSSNKVLSVHADRQGFLWIGTQRGLQRLDRRTGQTVLYQHDPRDPYSLSHNAVTAIEEDGSDGLWIGTHGGGLDRFDRASGRFFAYRHNPKDPQSLSGDLVLTLFLEPGGALWVGTRGSGLNRFDPATAHFKTYRPDPGDPNSLSNDRVKAILTDRAGTLWVGTNYGLNRFDRGTERFTVYRHDENDPNSLSNEGVTSIYEDRQGILWIGTRRGLNRLNRTHSSFENFTTKDGLASDFIEAIREDTRGNLWLATYTGLSEFRPQTKTVRNYSEADGLSGDYHNPSGGGHRSCVTPEGQLVFASDNAATVFNPNQVSANPFLPPVVLTDFLLFNKPVLPGRNSPLQQPIWATQSLTLDHNQSIFTLEFAALSYVAPERNRYRYKLESLEKDWNEVGGERRVATYTSLPPGKYVFRVQGSNNDGIWNEKGVNLAITVLPPWYATWTFRVAIVLFAAGLLVAAHQMRVRGLQLAAARLERQVAERTRELEAAKESAETANRAKSAFLSHMSHELRTPLNAILGFANLLRGDATSAKQRTDLDIIHRSGEHLLGLIDDVLDIARIEAGRATLEIAACDLRRLIRDVTDMIRVRASEKNLELCLVQSPEFPQAIETDAAKLRQMLINLLGNAIKNTERGSVTLRLDVRRTADAGQVLLSFEVQDTGVGIAPEDQKRIFELFVQVGKTRQKGTGLGLAITHQFAAMLGGTIQVTSALGEGSLFRLELPAKCVDQFLSGPAAVEREYVLEAGQPEYRILVVDDAVENRQLLERLLLKAGFQVRVAEDGAQAAEAFRSWRPHFIWMDLRMPEVDGTEATRRIRTMDGGREVKIAAVTASANTHVAAGMDDLVHKPYRPNEIFHCMARHLGIHYRSDNFVPTPPVESSTTLRPTAFASLPDDLVAELKNAVISLDVNQITAVIARVSELDAELGSALAFHANRLAFSKIWEVLRDYKSVA